MSWDKIIDGEVLDTTGYRPHITGHGNITDGQLNDMGYYERLLGDIPSGKYASSWIWEGITGDKSVYSPVLADLPTPEYPQPDVTVPTVGDLGEQIGTSRVLVFEGVVIPVQDSASPQRPWTDQHEQLMELMTALQVERDTLKAVLKALSKDSKLDKATKDAAKAASDSADAADAKKKNKGEK